LVLHISSGSYDDESRAILMIDSDEFLEEFQLFGRKFKNNLKSLSLSNIALLKLNPVYFSSFAELSIINIRYWPIGHKNVTLKDARAHFKKFDEFILRSYKSKRGNEFYLAKAGNLISPFNWSEFHYWD
jgi:hypothetical protein